MKKDKVQDYKLIMGTELNVPALRDSLILTGQWLHPPPTSLITYNLRVPNKLSNSKWEFRELSDYKVSFKDFTDLGLQECLSERFALHMQIIHLWFKSNNFTSFHKYRGADREGIIKHDWEEITKCTIQTLHSKLMGIATPEPEWKRSSYKPFFLNFVFPYKWL